MPQLARSAIMLAFVALLATAFAKSYAGDERADVERDCLALATIVHGVAQARDRGMSEWQAAQIVARRTDADPRAQERARTEVSYVYTNTSLTPDFVRELRYRACMNRWRTAVNAERK